MLMGAIWNDNGGNAERCDLFTKWPTQKKKRIFSKPFILKKNSSATSEYIWPNCVVYCFFAKKTKQETSVTIGTFFLKNESTFLERPSLFSLTNFQFSSQNKLIDMHCESSQKYFIGSFVEHLDICKKNKVQCKIYTWSTNSFKNVVLELVVGFND